MAKKASSASGNVPPITIRFVNVILHGAFSFIFDPDCIWAYTPACFGHEYNAGTKYMDKNVKLQRLVDYSLHGVEKSEKQSVLPVSSCNPVLSLKEMGIDRGDIDVYKKRFTRIRLPYPAPRKKERPNLMVGAGNAYIGKVYSGIKASLPLNEMTMCPSIQILVYELKNGSRCTLRPNKAGLRPITASEVTSDPETLNFHIFCTKRPSMGAAMPAMGMTPEGHNRRTFSSVVDLIGDLELLMNFPDGFHPAVPPNEDLPIGVDPSSDVDPSKPGGPFVPYFGHVNCASGHIILVP